MISDIVCEYLVKRKLDTVQIAKAVGVFVAGFILSWFLRSVGVVADRTGMLATIFLLGGLAVTIYLARFMLMVEYEYTFVNGELTIDRILARSKRKHMLDINVKTVYKLGYINKTEINQRDIDTVKDFSTSASDENTVFACYKDESSGKKVMLLFTPNQKIIDSMKPYVSATVYREAFSKTNKN